MGSGWQPFFDILTLPTGATTGGRIVLDGTTGDILIYDNSNVVRVRINDGPPAPQIIFYDTAGNPRLIESAADDGGRIAFYSAAGVLRLLINALSAGEIQFLSGAGTEAQPGKILTFNDGAGRFGIEIRCPVATTWGGYGNVQITNDSVVGLAEFSAGVNGPASITGGVELLLFGASSQLTLDANGIEGVAPTNKDVYFHTNGAGGIVLYALGTGNVHTSNLQVDPGYTAYFGAIEQYGNLHVQANGQINLDAGSWIHRGGQSSPTLLNGWTNFGGGFQGAGYIEYPDKTAGLSGVIKPGTTTSGTTLFSIPGGITPAANHVFISPTAASGTSFASVVVEAGGAVKIQNPIGTQNWLSLSGCRWPMNGF